tara:strand:+ start:369030 stop:369395 length:366 start_codon:yes stop_codon:yes gene_type:complete
MFTREEEHQLRESCIPSPGRVAILPDTAVTMTEAGLHLAPTSADQETGVMFNVGPALEDFPHTFVPGQRAFFGKYSGNAFEVVISGKKVKVLVVSAQDILCTMASDTVIEGVETAGKAVSA